MGKCFVLDTNVLLHEPNAIRGFGDNDVIIPVPVLQELDVAKKRQDTLGANARSVIRQLEALRQHGSLPKGVPLESGGTLRAMVSSSDALTAVRRELHNTDHQAKDIAILAVAYDLMRSGVGVVMVSMDLNVRVQADCLGIHAEDLDAKIPVDDLYVGHQSITVSSIAIDTFFSEGQLSVRYAVSGDKAQNPNEAVMLVDEANPKHTALGVVSRDSEMIYPLSPEALGSVSRISAVNREQKMALHLLLDPGIPLVTLVGKAGTGKTLLAIAAGLHLVADQRIYSRLLIARPVVPMGKDIGFLPGDIREKMTPWMQPLYDNFDLILGARERTTRSKHSRRGHEELIEQGLLQIEPLTYIRGRTLPNQFIVVDEAQNLTPLEVKTIATRAGSGTKIVLTGDVEQIDNPYVDASSNGLTYVVDRFKHDPLAGHITLTKGERSLLAERASQLL